MEIIALALSLLAVILCIVILVKVNKLLTMLRTPIFKKLTPDMNLRPSSRRSVSAQDMAQRDRNNKDRKDRQNKDNRGDKNGQAQQGQNRDRNEQRENRGSRRDRREGRPDRPRREFNNAEAPAAAVAAEAAPAAAEAPVEVAETTFDPAKVRYGRRNVIKKAPELADDDA